MTPFTLYWINFQGCLTNYGTVAPGTTSAPQQTYGLHRWLVRSMEPGTDDVVFVVGNGGPDGDASYREAIADGVVLHGYGFGLECGYEPSPNPGEDPDLWVSITNGSEGSIFIKWIDGDGCLDAAQQFEIGPDDTWGPYPTRQDHRWIVVAPDIEGARFEGTFQEWDYTGILAAFGVSPVLATPPNATGS